MDGWTLELNRLGVDGLEWTLHPLTLEVDAAGWTWTLDESLGVNLNVDAGSVWTLDLPLGLFGWTWTLGGWTWTGMQARRQVPWTLQQPPM
jgi:hypothetical protein